MEKLLSSGFTDENTSTMLEIFVKTEAIKEAVLGRETEILDALNIHWNSKNHINCPYPDHGDRNPSWRWDSRTVAAFCTCSAGDNIFEVVRKMNSGDFDKAKIHVAEYLGRHDLIVDPNKTRTSKTDATSLLSPPENRTDPGLTVAYLAHRLQIGKADVLMPSTLVAGWKDLEYWDPPITSGKPILVGRFPCCVFSTVDANGKTHAHRIYVASGGKGKANLGTRTDETGRKIERDVKKSAKKKLNEKTAGRSVIWGDPTQAAHMILSEGAETGAALAFAFKNGVLAKEIAVAAGMSTAGIKAFMLWPNTKRITVAGDHDPNGQGLKAAQAFAKANFPKLSVSIAIPSQPGDWLDVFLKDGLQSVIDGIAEANPFTQDDVDTPLARQKTMPTNIGDFAMNEDGIALAFADRHKDELRFCHTVGKWFHWDGTRWKKEGTKLAFALAREICRDVNQTGAKVLAKASTSGAVEKFAQADRSFAVTSDIWDQDPWLLGTPDGTIDLHSGVLRQPKQSDFITKQTSVGPAPYSECPVWFQFLDEATQGDEDLKHFLQQISGYCLTGDIREHALIFIHGDGGNGKGVFLNTINNILGEYATTAAMDTFTASRSDRHPTDMAWLQGARLVSASETEKGRAWAETRVKQLTGGDPITARFMRQDFFTFQPQFKLLIIGNHKPILKNVDAAARRRFNIIPFVHKPIRPDRCLEAKLRAEYPAILRWMVDGCISWQQHGLKRPEVVLDATKDYFESQDSFQQWIEESCEVERNKSDTTARLFDSWKTWAMSNGEDVGSQKLLSEHLIKVGFNPVRHTPGFRGKRGFQGITVHVEIKSNWQEKE